MLKTHTKELIWLGDSLEAIKSFSVEARKAAGHELGQVQEGRDLPTGNRWRVWAPV